MSSKTCFNVIFSYTFLFQSSYSNSRWVPWCLPSLFMTVEDYWLLGEAMACSVWVFFLHWSSPQVLWQFCLLCFSIDHTETTLLFFFICGGWRCVCVFPSILAHMCTHVHRGPMLMLRVFLNHFLPCSLRQSHSIKTRPCQYGLFHGSTSLSSEAGITGRLVDLLDISLASRNHSSSLHPSTVSTLMTGYCRPTPYTVSPDINGLLTEWEWKTHLATAKGFRMCSNSNA